jgi:hypothetical protein
VPLIISATSGFNESPLYSNYFACYDVENLFKQNGEKGLREELKNMNFDYPEKIEALNPKQRRYFYELFAHFLTVSLRGVLFTEGLENRERVERAKWLNEIQHRITHKIFVTDKKPDAKWTDAEILEMIRLNIEKYPAIERDVNAALELTYGYILENESDNPD